MTTDNPAVQHQTLRETDYPKGDMIITSYYHGDLPVLLLSFALRLGYNYDKKY
jgi:hypothetical protein